jgi:tetratricopeptide (TPR) repeat protein
VGGRPPSEAENEGMSAPDPASAGVTRGDRIETVHVQARRAWWRRVDPMLAVCLAWLLLFPLLAALVAAGEPLRSDAVVLPPAAPAGHAPVRAVPVFAGARPSQAVLSSPAAMRGALFAAAREVLGAREGPALVRLALQRGSLRAPGAGGAVPTSETLLRFPAVERILRRRLAGALNARAIAAANDLGALLIDAATMREAENSYGRAFPQAGEVAFAVLDRARAEGACDPQLNLAFAVAAAGAPRERDGEVELRRAARDCPHDPTPLWLLGELQSEYAQAPSAGQGGGVQVGLDTRGPFATFALLRGRFPRSAAGWAGAGDAELRVAYETSSQPFTARAHFRRALAFYLAAQQLEPNPEIAAGTARAYAGLRQYSAAVAAQRTAAEGRGHEVFLQAPLVEYLERDRAFGQAAAAAEPLIRAARFPVGEGRMMPGNPPDVGEASAQEVGGPLSIGADRFTPATIDLGDENTETAAGAAEESLPFLHVYREVEGVTDYSRWCPAWSLRRDEILAGHATAALAGLQQQPASSIRPGVAECPTASRDLLAGIAAYEAGKRALAERLVEREPPEPYSEEPRDPRARLDDARQNVWRFAGDFQRARTAAAEWRAVAPGEAQAFVKAGEIEYFAGRYDPAARLFAHATWLLRTATALPTVAEAEALLLRGVALARAEREAEALRTLEAAEATAESAQGAERHATASAETEYSEEEEGGGTAALLAYNALAQIGHADLAAHHFTLAAEAYEAALERFDKSEGARPAEENFDPYSAAYDDLSLAQTQIGKLHEAAASARLAVAPDPMDPLTLATQGHALAQLGRYGEARASLLTAVEQLPSQFSAWNDLGYVEDRLGRSGAAVSDYRHAVGANSRYALGWFNLGVELERQGLLHALAAQGAFGRAIAVEPSLSTRSHRLSLDDRVYITNLDISKPLPPNWSFTTVEKRPLAGSLGLVLLLVATLQLGRVLAGGQAGGAKAAEWLLQATQTISRRLPGRGALAPAALAPAALAVAGTLLVFLLPLLRSGAANFAQATLLALGVGAIVAVIWRSRVLVARRRQIALTQRGWPPAIAVGVVAAALGIAFAPLPVASADGDAAAAVHWIGPVLATALALALLILSTLLHVPIAQTLAGAALVMAASMLIPIKPLDGGVVTDATGSGAAAGLALLGGGLFLLLGLR